MEFNKHLPIYEQLIHYFKQEIVKGSYQAGQVLPSRRELAQTMGVNPNTVQKAYKEMEEMKLIITESNVQSRVTEDQSIIQGIKQTLLEEAIRHLLNEVAPLGIQEAELIAAIQQYRREGGESLVASQSIN